jgi:hypothetical protein
MNVTGGFGAVMVRRKSRIHAGFRGCANAQATRRRRTAAWSGGQIAQFGASGEMRKVVEWQYLWRGERIFILSAAENGGDKSRERYPTDLLH